jgi:arylsulfatase A-like enzyme
MCLQLLSLDRDLGDFFAFLDRSGLDYAVALTADHGGEDLPERLRLKGIASAQRVDSALAASAVGKAIGAKLRLSGPVLLGDVSGDMYIDRALPAADRARVLAEALRMYRAHPQVAAVFSADELAHAPRPSGPPDQWPLIERARASFDPQRSGDFVVLLKEHVTPIGHVTNSVATHGSPWDYDRRVPILFWRKDMTATSRDDPVETVDLMPTLAAQIGVSLAPGTVDGHCLGGVSGIACPR